MATFHLDPNHSSVEFTIRHMVFSKVRGNFEKFDATLEADEATGAPTRIEATIDASSIDTHVGDRDNHLRSPDFLDVANHPTITFVSRSVAGGPVDFSVVGDLTIHGTTKSVTLAVSLDGRGKDPWGNDRIAFSASTKINRKDFGLGWNQALETGGVLVGEELDIAITIQAVHA